MKEIGNGGDFFSIYTHNDTNITKMCVETQKQSQENTNKTMNNNINNNNNNVQNILKLPSRFKRVCVFCGSSTGKRDSYRHAAIELGQELVARSLDLVYGGGSIGLKGLVSQTVHQGGCHVIGIIPKTLLGKEVIYETRANNTRVLESGVNNLYNDSSEFSGLIQSCEILFPLFKLIRFKKIYP